MKAPRTNYGHSKKTDNDCIEDKIALRKFATQNIDKKKVLDLFAGENLLWKTIPTERYYGVEIEKNKGQNAHGDNLKFIPTLNLSEYNIIDLDSYGIPFNQIYTLYANRTLKKGTVIIFTAITNKMSGVNKSCLKIFKMERMYRKCKVLINSKAMELFYAFLEMKGVKKIKYYSKKTSFSETYGYFIVE